VECIAMLSEDKGSKKKRANVRVKTSFKKQGKTNYWGPWKTGGFIKQKPEQGTGGLITHGVKRAARPTPHRECSEQREEFVQGKKSEK